jgi:hypothetical protein
MYQIGELPIDLQLLDKQECRRITVLIHYRVVGGFHLQPERIEFDYEEIPPEQVTREMLGQLPKDLPPPPPIPEDDEEDDDDVKPTGDCKFAVHMGERRLKFECTPPRCGAIETFPFTHVTKEGPGCPATFKGYKLEEKNDPVNSGCSNESIAPGGGCKLEEDGTLTDCRDDIGVCLASGEKEHPPAGKSCTDKWEQKLFLTKLLSGKTQARKNEIKVKITRSKDGRTCKTEITHTKTGGEGTGPTGGGGSNVEPTSDCDGRPCREETGVPCPEPPSPLSATWPSLLPHWSTGAGQTDLPTRVRTNVDPDEIDGIEKAKRGTAQGNLRDAIKEAQDRFFKDGDERPIRQLLRKKGCKTNQHNQPGGEYQAHHIHPLFLGGTDVDENLCACEQTDTHQPGHNQLKNQAEHLDEYRRECCYCTALLEKHPSGQEYDTERRGVDI